MAKKKVEKKKGKKEAPVKEAPKAAVVETPPKKGAKVEKKGKEKGKKWKK